MSTSLIGAPSPTRLPEFKASSGRLVRSHEDGSVSFGLRRGYIAPEEVMDAQEFFRAQSDLDRGWWRCPAEPEWVAKEDARDAYGRRVVALFNERTFTIHYVNSFVADAPAGDDRGKHRAARAYFEAHPERKPWEDAKPGEVWALRTADGREVAYAVMSVAESGVVFESHDWRYDLDNIAIKSGRRIWPEDAS